jgi:hypothetical protein
VSAGRRIGNGLPRRSSLSPRSPSVRATPSWLSELLCIFGADPGNHCARWLRGAGGADHRGHSGSRRPVPAMAFRLEASDLLSKLPGPGSARLGPGRINILRGSCFARGRCRRPRCREGGRYVLGNRSRHTRGDFAAIGSIHIDDPCRGRLFEHPRSRSRWCHVQQSASQSAGASNCYAIGSARRNSQSTTRGGVPLSHL